MIKIAVFTGNRAEYGLLHPVIKALIDSKRFQVHLIVSAGHLLEEYGGTIEEIEKEGLDEIITICETANSSVGNQGMFLEFGDLVKQGGVVLNAMQPEMLLIAGDRYETFAIAIAAFYNNIPLAHIFGGDLSQGGHLDDSVRHAITKLAHLHFTTNEDSYKRVLHLGEENWRVFLTGSPSIDSVAANDFSTAAEVEEQLGISPGEQFILFTQHPVTTESAHASSQIVESLEALKEMKMKTVITYPCNDAGGDAIIKTIQQYGTVPHFIIRKSLGHKLYLGAMKRAACIAGNSSSGMMETPVFKVPCVNIGTRQAGRLRSTNVIDAGYNRKEILTALQRATGDETFRKTCDACLNPYGEGDAAQKICEVLSSRIPKEKLLRKQMTY